MEVIAITTLLVIIGALTILHFSTRYSRSGKLMEKIPGPKGLPILGNILELIVPVEKLWYQLREWADTYHEIYKFYIGPTPVLNIRHPDDVEVLFSSQKHIEKSFFYDFFHPWLGEGLLTSTGDKWRNRRKILTPAFHYKTLHEFVGAFTENSQHMVNALKAEGGQVVKDIESFFAKYTLNNICETSMGTSLQDQVPVHDGYRDAIKQMGEIIYYRSMRPWVKNDWVFACIPKGAEQRGVLKLLHNFTNKIVRERKQYHEENGGKYLVNLATAADDKSAPAVDEGITKKKRLAMLDILIAAQKERGYIDDRGIREEVDTFVFEGHDTTEMGLCFTVLLLAEHKEIQERARAEVDFLMKVNDGKLGMGELQSLSYLDRCIKEALRLFPSVPLVSRIIKEDMQLKKYLIPAGTIVNAHIVDVHRDPEFWPEPHVYDPDRFLPERLQGRHPFSYVPFSAGPRNCIGQKFAMLELKSTLAMLLHHFYLEPVTPLSQVRISSNVVMKTQNTLNVKFIPTRR